MEEAADIIVRLVQKISGRQHVSPQTLLWHDLQLGGDDMFELLGAVHQQFDTSFEGLNFTSFFPEEHEAMGAGWASKLGFRSKLKPVSVQHLVDVVRQGQWFDPPAA